MADAGNPVTVVRTGNKVRVQVYGNFALAAERLGNVKLWQDRQVTKSGVVEPEPERFYEFVFADDASATAFESDAKAKVNAAKAAVGPVT